MAEAPVKKRGPYKRYTVDPNAKVPKMTRLRQQGTQISPISTPAPSTQSDDSNAEPEAETESHTSDELNFQGDLVHEASSTISVNFEQDFTTENEEADEQDIGGIADDDKNHNQDFERLVGVPIFEGARITVAESMLLIQGFVMRHSLSEEALSNLLSLIELHSPQPNECRRSVHSFRRLFENNRNGIQRCFYCSHCLIQLKVDSKEKVCSNCKRYITNDYFLMVPLEDQLSRILTDGVTDLTNHRESRNAKQSESENHISDVLDGQLYKDAFDGSYFRGSARKKDEIHISLQFNTDGVALFKSSKYSVWPAYFTINELPPHLRFTRQYRLFGGMWFGSSKPHMDIFLQPFIEQLLQMYTSGVTLILNRVKKIVRVILLSGVFDAPARATIQNFVQFNGYYGCASCLARGASTANLKGTKTHTYPFETDEKYYMTGYPEKRTRAQTERYAKKADNTNKPNFGIKGSSHLASLPSFDIIRGVTIDYMHCVSLGVMKSLLDLWTNSEYKYMNWYIGNSLEEMDYRLLNLSPPNKITRIPRSLKDLGNWKASEFRSFLLFYSVPVLENILKDEHLKHFLSLVTGVYLLLKSSISSRDLNMAQEALLCFCMKYDAMYHPCFESSNVHALLHLCEKVSDLGPLWAHSCFFYEDLNGDLRSLFHGTVNAAMQILNAVCVKQVLPLLAAHMIPGSPAALLYEDMTTYHRIRSKMEDAGDGIYAIEPIQSCSLSEEVYELVAPSLGMVDSSIFYRILKEGIVIHSLSYKAVRRRNSYTVMFQTDNAEVKYGMVQYFLKNVAFESISYCAVINELEVEDVEHSVLRIPHMLACKHRRDKLHLVPVKNIRELCVFLEGKKQNYIGRLPNKVERE